MGMSLLDQIPTGATVTVDSAPIIYVLADRAPFAERFVSLFQAAEQSRLRIAISSITLAEVLVGPLRVGDELLAEKYRRTLISAKGWRLVSLSAEIAVSAARIRAHHNLKLPDAIQVATALATESSALITHDRDFRGAGSTLPILGV
jgi:predicted nucleic acid-binding protein